MPLSWNEIKGRAIAFAKEWGQAGDERAQAQSFWIEFFADLFWPGMLLIEPRSRGKSLNRAFGQALDDVPGIKDARSVGGSTDQETVAPTPSDWVLS